MAESKKRSKSSQTAKKTNQEVLPPETENAESSEALKSDLLDDFLFHAANYVYVKRKLFISLAVAAIAIIVAVWGTIKYIEYLDNTRNEELFKIEQIIYNAQLEEEQMIKTAIPLLDTFIQEHGGTEQYNLALYYRAGLNTKQKQFAQAESDLQLLLDSLEPGTDLFFLATLNLSNVLRDQNRTDEAFELLQSVKSESVTDIVLMEQAEIYMNSNRQDKAKELLEILLKDYPSSYYANKAKQLLEIL